MLRTATSRQTHRILRRYLSNKVAQKTNTTEQLHGLDARVLTGAAVATAALAYAFWPSNDGSTAPAEEAEPLYISGEGETELASHHQDQLHVEFRDDGTTSEDDKIDTQMETPTIVDSHAVLGVIEDVMSKPAEQLLRETEERASAKIGGGPGERSQEATTSASSVSQEEERRSEKHQLHHHSSTDRLPKEDGEGEEEIQAAHLAVTTAISDTAGESVASQFAKSTTDLRRKSSPSSSPHPQRDELRSHPPPATVVHPSSAEQLSAASLIAAATARHPDRAVDWSSFPARHRQAEDDAITAAALLAQEAEKTRQDMRTARATVDAALRDAEEARRNAAEEAERFRDAMKGALRDAQAAHEAQLRRQAERLTAAHAETTVRERADRQAKVDALRVRLGVLEQALTARNDAAKSSMVAHRLAQGAFALQAALAQGRSGDDAAGFIAAACGDDALVRAAVASVPRGESLSTPLQLAEEFHDVERVVTELAWLPAGKGGMLSAATAKLFAALKVRERVLRDEKNLPCGSDDGVAARLAQVRAHAAGGRLSTAAEQLEEAVRGTAAAPAVMDWIRKARARAMAEQAAALLEAHAAAATVPLGS